MRFFVVSYQEIGGLRRKPVMLISYSSPKLLSDFEFLLFVLQFLSNQRDRCASVDSFGFLF